MIIRLGYVALPLSINITSSHGITYTNYLKNNRDNSLLDKVIKSNFYGLKEILKYNIKNNITFYRMTSKLIPLATKSDVIFDYEKKYNKEFLELGNIIKKNNLRIDTHPDQYCVINSINDSVVQSSIKILEFHYNIFKLMDIDSKMIIHVGSSVPNKDEAIKRFIEVFKNLDKEISSCVILENDDKIYDVNDVLNICKTLEIPMVLDYHHFLCNNSTGKIDDYLQDIFKTWEGTSLVPKIHFSSPKNSREFRTHNDYIDSDSFIEFIDILKQYNQDVDIMLEAKAKDEALFRLVRELKYKTDYKFLNETTFEIK